MKKYLLFAGHRHYPLGGVEDFHGDFDSIDEAKKWFGSNPDKISNPKSDYIDHWCQIVDKDTFEIVAKFEQKHVGKVVNNIPGPIIIPDDTYYMSGEKRS